MIECKNISKHYYIGEEKITALENISFTVEKGEFVSITGQSGSGKSTLLNILGCLDKPSEGSYYIDGKNVNKIRSGGLCRVRGRKIGFVFQAFHLVSGLTALENVELPLYYRGYSHKKRAQIALDALCAVGMENRKNHLPSQLSGGQMQRVAIARAIVSRPELLLADEPTGNLDSQNSGEILRLLKKLNGDGMTLIIVTHDKGIAELTDRRIKLVKGHIDEMN